MGPFSERATDIDVVRDLMIHDLDILQQLLGEEPDRVESIGIPVLTPNVDIANARLSYPSGCVANLTASRVSRTPMRKIRFFQPNGYFSIDFLEQSAVVFRRERAGEGAEPEIQIERPVVSRGDALLAQLRCFLEALRTRVQPDGAALGALRTALRVIDAMPSLDELE
jgi:predicted dehydrogenase